MPAPTPSFPYRFVVDPGRKVVVSVTTDAHKSQAFSFRRRLASTSDDDDPWLSWEDLGSDKGWFREQGNGWRGLHRIYEQAPMRIFSEYEFGSDGTVRVDRSTSTRVVFFVEDRDGNRGDFNDLIVAVSFV